MFILVEISPFVTAFGVDKLNFPVCFVLIQIVNRENVGHYCSTSHLLLLHGIRILSLINSEFSNYGHFNKREKGGEQT